MKDDKRTCTSSCPGHQKRRLLIQEDFSGRRRRHPRSHSFFTSMSFLVVVATVCVSSFNFQHESIIRTANSFTFLPTSGRSSSSSSTRYRVSSDSRQIHADLKDGANQLTMLTTPTTSTTLLRSSRRSYEKAGEYQRIDEENDNSNPEFKGSLGTSKMKRWLSSVVLTAVMTMSSPTFDVVMPSLSINQHYHSQQIRLSLSSSSSTAAWALSPEQLLVDDVWREVTRQFVDPTFHGLGEDGWKQKRLEALKAVADLGPPEPTYDDEDDFNGNTKDDPNEPVYNVIRKMLSSLDDPYTRFLTPAQYVTLTNAFTTPTSSSSSSSSSSSKSQPSGIGVQLIGSPSTSKTSSGKSNGGEGGVIVANTISNGAAAKAGILPGDIIRKIDGVDVTSATADVVAAQCRGDTGSRVIVEIERPSSSNQVTTLTLTRSPISSYQSVQTSVVTMMMPASSNDGQQQQQQQQQRTGVIRLASFTQDTFDQVSTALKDMLETQKVDALVLDVRGNAGGYMPAGVDVAKLFLAPRARIITEVDRTGRATIYINDGVGSETTLPLYILVDQRTASASEIMTAALQDNGRAKVVAGVGIDHTFGKGRIQNVQGLQTGAGIAVTKAKYLSPKGRDIHGVGITPDKQSKTCDLKDSALSCLEGLV